MYKILTKLFGCKCKKNLKVLHVTIKCIGGVSTHITTFECKRCGRQFDEPREVDNCISDMVIK